MSCCGSQRQSIAARSSQRGPQRAASAALPARSVGSAGIGAEPSATRAAAFQYRGTRSLSVENPGTGRRYDFPAPGASVQADAADVSWLQGIPWLARIA